MMLLSVSASLAKDIYNTTQTNRDSLLLVQVAGDDAVLQISHNRNHYFKLQLQSCVAVSPSAACVGVGKRPRPSCPSDSQND